jgi:hypothetical protein
MDFRLAWASLLHFGVVSAVDVWNDREAVELSIVTVATSRRVIKEIASSAASELGPKGAEVGTCRKLEAARTVDRYFVFQVRALFQAVGFRAKLSSVLEPPSWLSPHVGSVGDIDRWGGSLGGNLRRNDGRFCGNLGGTVCGTFGWALGRFLGRFDGRGEYRSGSRPWGRSDR